MVSMIKEYESEYSLMPSNTKVPLIVAEQSEKLAKRPPVLQHSMIRKLHCLKKHVQMQTVC